MKFEVHLPCERLLPYVKHLVISENEQENSYRILPDTALVIGFTIGANAGRLLELTPPERSRVALPGDRGPGEPHAGHRVRRAGRPRW